MSSQVHLIFLYHPTAESRTSPLPDAIVRRLESVYRSGNCTIHVAHIRYGFLPSTGRTSGADEGADLDRFLSASSSLSISSFSPSSVYWQQRDQSGPNSAPSILLNVVNDIKQPRLDTGHDLLQSFMEPNGKPSSSLGCLADGLVAAVELFSRATPLTTHPLARYLVHLLPDTPSLDMNDSSFPHSNLDSTHDRWSWIKAAQELGKMGVWPSTHVIPLSPNAIPSSLTPECEKVHKCILDELPSMYPSITDTPSILGGQYKGTSNGHGLLLSGFSDASATAARATAGVSAQLNKKRGRKASMGSKSLKDKDREEGQPASSTTDLRLGASTADGQTSSVGRIDLDKGTVNRILFLQQHQQKMMGNLAIAARLHQTKAPDQDSPARKRLLEHFRDQLIAQQAALKAQAAIVYSGGAVPNLNNSLTELMAIDKDASEKGLQLGGPGGLQQSMMQRQKQAMQQQMLQQQQSTVNPPMNDASTALAIPAVSSAMPSLLTASPQMQAQQKKPGGVQAFWSGAILWTIALPNNKRNQAMTIVSAHCAPNTSKDTLLLPWPQRLNISEVQAISMSSLQAYAAKNSTSCILFQPLNAAALPRPQGGAPPQQSNETMYVMLAKMIDSKKSCAYISLQKENPSSEAGIVIVPTPTQAGGNSRRLLGLVFRHAVPWHLFGSTAGQPPTLQGQQMPQAPQQLSMPPAGQFGTSSSTAPQSQVQASLSSLSLQQGLFQPQQHASQLNSSLTSAPSHQQLPVWAQPIAPTSFAPSHVNSNDGSSTPFAPSTAPPLPSASPADILGSSGIDFDTLSRRLNFPGQPQVNQQQPAPPSVTAGMFNSNIWNTPTTASQTNQQQAIDPPSSSSIDLEALQRLLGLNST